MKRFATIIPGAILCIGLACSPSKTSPIDLDRRPERPELFGEGVITTALFERDVAISKNGKEIIHTLGTHDQRHRVLVVLRKYHDSWLTPKMLPFCGRHNDIEPFLAFDGTRLYFASDRPMGTDSTRNDYNIWMVDRNGEGWGSPQPLDSVINTRGDEFYPSVSRKGNLYFTATRDDGHGREDIFMSPFDGKRYQKPVALDTTINSSSFEFNAFVDPEEQWLIFSSFGREDGLGGGDLYLSRKDAQGSWSPARNLGTLVNSDRLDYSPFVDLPRGNLYFTSTRVDSSQRETRTVEDFVERAESILNGSGNIYRVGLGPLGLEGYAGSGLE